MSNTTNQPSPQQQAVYDFVKDPSKGSLNLIARAGTGKCLGAGTPVMLYSGEIKPVEEIAEGDLLMGPDSSPRKVINVSKGYGPLWRITPIKGDPWVCNDAHVMTLMGTNRYMGQVMDIGLVDFLSSQVGTSRPDKNWKIFRVPLEFTEKPVPFHPYLVGVWLGDGSIGEPQFTFGYPKLPVLWEVERLAKDAGYTTRVSEDDGQESFTLRIKTTEDKPGYQATHHPFRQFVRRELVVDGQKRILPEYLKNSVETRSALLAGILDTDGSQSGAATFDLVTKYEGLRDDILFLARSLGFAAYASPKPVQLDGWDKPRIYWRISISGDPSTLPLIRLERSERKQVKNVLKTGWDATPIGDGNYYGFTLDGDGRFLLGDFTVTHNTTTLMGIASRVKEPGFVGAFNKAIADEFKERLALQKSFHMKGGTIHSAGFAAWAKVNSNLGSPDSRKVEKLARQKASWDRKLISVIRETVGYAKQQCLGVADQPCYDNPAPWQAIIDYYDLTDDIPSAFKGTAFIEMCMDVYRESLALCERVIDFDDMLLAPLYFEAPFNKYHWVMMDEWQDANTARRLIMLAMMRPGSRAIWVADDKQSIYGFAGADSSSVQQTMTAVENWEKASGTNRPITSLKLSVTYRCPKTVVKLANTWVPDFEAHQDAPQGLVTLLNHQDLWNQSFAWNDVILCRNTRPLVGIAQRLRDKQIPCMVEGMNSKGLMNLATKWGEDLPIGDFLEELDSYRSRESAKWAAKGKMDKVEYIEDKAGTLRDLSRSVVKKNGTVQDLVRRIDFIFGNLNDGRVLKLCTIHRSKGREWNRVYLVGRNRYMPSPYAKKDWERREEENICYVAVTRAKVELVEVEVPFKQPGSDLEWWERGWRECEDDQYVRGDYEWEPTGQTEA